VAKGSKSNLAELEASIGHSFRDSVLLKRALTHVSAVKNAAARGDTYQRLEFLGDRVLGLSVSDMLFSTFPRADEGELSRRLAELVRKETCAEVAADWGVGPHVRFGGGESLEGASKKVTILADACESIIGAVFLDAGFEAARDVVRRSWDARMMSPRRPLRDPKTALQEWAQARGLSTPVYREMERSGPAHSPVFLVEVQVEQFPSMAASGASKRVAEQSAAKAFMEREGVIDRKPRKPRAESESGV
jgi:ribonuclease-3